MKNQMNKQKGFTLIELIIVIVILGILAVTAAPRFIDLQSDAKASTLQGVKGALQGASQLVYAKAAINGQLNGTEASPESVPISNSVNVSTVNGYPNAILIPATQTLSSFIDLDTTNDFTVINIVSTPADPAEGEFIIAIGSTGVEADNCFVRYVNAGVDASPLIEVVATGC